MISCPSWKHSSCLWKVSTSFDCHLHVGSAQGAVLEWSGECLRKMSHGNHFYQADSSSIIHSVLNMIGCVSFQKLSIEAFTYLYNNACVCSHVKYRHFYWLFLQIIFLPVGDESVCINKIWNHWFSQSIQKHLFIQVQEVTGFLGEWQNHSLNQFVSLLSAWPTVDY